MSSHPCDWAAAEVLTRWLSAGAEEGKGGGGEIEIGGTEMKRWIDLSGRKYER